MTNSYQHNIILYYEHNTWMKWKPLIHTCLFCWWNGENDTIQYVSMSMIWEEWSQLSAASDLCWYTNINCYRSTLVRISLGTPFIVNFKLFTLLFIIHFQSWSLKSKIMIENVYIQGRQFQVLQFAFLVYNIMYIFNHGLWNFKSFVCLPCILYISYVHWLLIVVFEISNFRKRSDVLSSLVEKGGEKEGERNQIKLATSVLLILDHTCFM